MAATSGSDSDSDSDSDYGPYISSAFDFSRPGNLKRDVTHEEDIIYHRFPAPLNKYLLTPGPEGYSIKMIKRCLRHRSDIIQSPEQKEQKRVGAFGIPYANEGVHNIRLGVSLYAFKISRSDPTFKKAWKWAHETLAENIHYPDFKACCKSTNPLKSVQSPEEFSLLWDREKEIGSSTFSHVSVTPTVPVNKADLKRIALCQPFGEVWSLCDLKAKAEDEEMILPDEDADRWLQVVLRFLAFVIADHPDFNLKFTAAIVEYMLCANAQTYHDDPYGLLQAYNGLVAELVVHGIDLFKKVYTFEGLTGYDRTEHFIIRDLTECYLQERNNPKPSPEGVLCYLDSREPDNSLSSEKHQPDPIANEKVRTCFVEALYLHSGFSFEESRSKVVDFLHPCATVASLALMFKHIEPKRQSSFLDLLEKFKQNPRLQNKMFASVTRLIGKKSNSLKILGLSPMSDSPIPTVRRPSPYDDFYVSVFKGKYVDVRHGRMHAHQFFKWIDLLRNNSWKQAFWFRFLHISDQDEFSGKGLVKNEVFPGYPDQSQTWSRWVAGELSNGPLHNFFHTQTRSKQLKGVPSDDYSFFVLFSWNQEAHERVTKEAYEFFKADDSLQLSSYISTRHIEHHPSHR